MNKLHALPRTYGYVLIMLGITFFLPSLAVFQLYMIPELWTHISQLIGWSNLMFAWSVVSIVISGVMIAYGCDILWYHDKKSDSKSIEDNAKDSKYAPEPDEESNEK